MLPQIDTSRIAATHERRRITVAGREREYLLFTPPAPHGARLPLVVVYHGGGGTAELAALATGWSDLAVRAGFAVAYPEGVRRDAAAAPSFIRNPQFWNVAAGFGHSERRGVDDVGFSRTLIETLCDELPIDKRRVYGSGFSNGGSMAFRAGVELADIFAAVAPVAGHLWLKEPPPRPPPPLIYISGDADPLCPLLGGEIRSPWGRLTQLPRVDESILTWARWMGLSLRPRAVTSQGGVTRATFAAAQSVPPGATAVANEIDSDVPAIEFYTIAGAGHVWPGGVSVMNERISGPATDKLHATDVIWEFFVQRSRRA